MGDDDILHVVVGLGSVIDNFFFFYKGFGYFQIPDFYLVF